MGQSAPLCCTSSGAPCGGQPPRLQFIDAEAGGTESCSSARALSVRRPLVVSEADKRPLSSRQSSLSSTASDPSQKGSSDVSNTSSCEWGGATPLPECASTRPSSKQGCVPEHTPETFREVEGADWSAGAGRLRSAKPVVSEGYLATACPLGPAVDDAPAGPKLVAGVEASEANLERQQECRRWSVCAMRGEDSTSEEEGHMSGADEECRRWSMCVMRGESFDFLMEAEESELLDDRPTPSRTPDTVQAGGSQLQMNMQPSRSGLSAMSVAPSSYEAHIRRVTARHLVKEMGLRIMRGITVQVVTQSGEICRCKCSMNRELDTLKLAAAEDCQEIPLANIRRAAAGGDGVTAVLTLADQQCCTLMLATSEARDDFLACLHMFAKQAKGRLLPRNRQFVETPGDRFRKRAVKAKQAFQARNAQLDEEAPRSPT